ncbi:DUF125-domain-containing protein [Nadsonia fulvescens var. elongata DSM 6958]|uniref:DUF125-domain-containing protein n=1 Tax=Nadsonia fulvescens var. elongata DSM 6958 TaxID=857566 RepID=A0A1E3PGD9_9ASCO|nr:DUF125-domain-containing protein [Nadsonia fulvescens var. elongata DSM 6958]
MSFVSIKNAVSKRLSTQDSSSSSERLLPTTERNRSNQSPSHYDSFEDNAVNNAGMDNSEDRSTTTSKTASSDSSGYSSGYVPPRVMSDAIIGLSDGLTVPFALTAGLSGLGDSKVVITGGLAELVSGAISMGIGGYLAAKSETEYYYTQVNKERNQVKENHNMSVEEVEAVLTDFDLSQETISLFVKDLDRNKHKLVDFIVQYSRGLEEPAENRQLTSALTIGGGYFFGGFIPLIPYFFASTVQTGLWISCLVMVITLFTFGATKTVVSLGSEANAIKIIKNGFIMLLTGGLAASAAWGMVKLIDTN